jgi:cytochrome c oxidase subunit II
MSEVASPETRHFTLWRGFAILVGLLVLALYILWAAYGAAPTSLRFLAETPTERRAVTPMMGMDTGGHGAAIGAMTPDKFREITMKFIADLSLPDGSVRPTRQWMEAMEAMEASGEAMGAQAEMDTAGPAEADEPIDVYVMAMRFAYIPRVLRLERGVRYNLRMMSMDVNHGASIHTGFAGHIMRRPAMVMSEMVMAFSKPGDYMMYCTVYCGVGHDLMKGKIIVE